jgi:hypothetical protein
VTRRLLTLVPATLAALAMSAAPALAGEDGDDSPPASPAPVAPAPAKPNSATLHSSSQGCVTGHRAKAWVSGTNIDNVAFLVDGKRVETDRKADGAGHFSFSMACTRLTVGAHRARAVVAFTAGANRTLRFQITRTRQTSARFTG